jgi:hypothetical protein
MAQKQGKTGTERRSGKDRRQGDKGPPGRVDRRRVVEPRKPEVAELNLSDSEWGALTDAAFTPPAKKKPPEGGAS